MKDGVSGVRWAAARALGQIGPDAKAAVPALLETLKDEHEVRVWANYALFRIVSHPEAIPNLIEALKDQYGVVREVPVIALGNIGPDARAAVPALIEALNVEQEWIRRRAAWALGKIGPGARAAVPALIEALRDENRRVGVSAHYALFRIVSHPEAIPNLIEALRQGTHLVREDAARVLGNIGPDAKAAVSALAEAQKDEVADVRWSAAEALKKIQAPE